MIDRSRVGIVVASFVLAASLGACGDSGTASTTPGTGIEITATAGPVCPVEQQPPDPACAPRPVVGAAVAVRDASGGEVATGQTDAAGTLSIELAAGEYVIEPAPVDGLMGTAEAVPATVVDGAMTPVVLAYDTGIR
jgi:hypothetical protein